MTTVQMTIEGMSCGHCVNAVRKALQAVDGVHVDNVTVGNATVSYDAQRTTPAALTDAVDDAGFSAHVSAA